MANLEQVLKKKEFSWLMSLFHDLQSQWGSRSSKQLLLEASYPLLKWLSDMDGLLLGAVTEKVRPCGPPLSAQGAQRQTAGAECHLEA